MKKIFITTAALCLFSFIASAQESRDGTPQEKAEHAKNVKGIMGKWKTTGTETEIVEEQLKPKKQEVENLYNGLFNNADWEFKPDGNFVLTNLVEGKSSTEKGTFTVVANKLTLYLSGNTLHCVMQMKADGNMVIAISITEKSRFGMEMKKQK
jgi:Lipocalin-like domain